MTIEDKIPREINFDTATELVEKKEAHAFNYGGAKDYLLSYRNHTYVRREHENRYELLGVPKK